MLRKRSRSHHKDQHMGHLICDSIPESCFHSDVLGQKQKTSSFFNVPGLFVGFSPKALESDSVKSPTSPLDFRVFPNLANPFRSPISPHEGHQKIWGCTKVGLSIIDSLDDEAKQSGKILRSSASKNLLFGPQMRIRTLNFQSCVDSFPKSLPKNYGLFSHTQIKKPSNLQVGNSDHLFGIRETKFQPEPFGKILSCSLDSGRFGSGLTSLTNRSTNSSSVNFGSGNGLNPVNSPPHLCGGNQILGNSSATGMNTVPTCIGSAHDFIGSLSAREIELSEDYTCVKTYGPNPKTTHIFGDCILECHNNNLTTLSENEGKKNQFPLAVAVERAEIPIPYPSSDFLSFCYSCQKKLEGEDIYMYRGEKAFCSWGCRSQEILIEEVMERTVDASPKTSPKSNTCEEEEIFETSIFTTT
ncbi:FCS-Like Zinc finger 10-like [Actinidia eriantha]|uniref:FCS-Like Zinc finger 10-like n=1 Tax=Actinidia eriantha TaxID=165200 RepID=UPI00258B1670|nr:FCS-Like Zinc finger 10-like [Actinidia eriantha]XP_057466853.1 FCS-Like Zinc finger 10-like [Actinidia eriantha]XP_057466854.1 FCS-Like Zinc finger 10-like [Actinidia eriantha]